MTNSNPPKSSPLEIEELRKLLLELSDSVYVPNDTKDYKGVKITIDITQLLKLIGEQMLLVVPKKLYMDKKEVPDITTQHGLSMYNQAIDDMNNKVKEIING